MIAVTAPTFTLAPALVAPPLLLEAGAPMLQLTATAGGSVEYHSGQRMIVYPFIRSSKVVRGKLPCELGRYDPPRYDTMKPGGEKPVIINGELRDNAWADRRMKEIKAEWYGSIERTKGNGKH